MKSYRLIQNVMHLAALASLATYFFTPAHAGAASSEWVATEGGDLRLVAEPAASDGRVPAILDIRLKPGWKTYWLEPGASGIPPQVSLDPAGGISFHGLRFPAPKTFDDGVVRYTGYDRPVALPLTLKRERPGDLAIKATVFLGICKDICIPVQADLSLPLPDDLPANPLDNARIEDAVAALPEAPSDTFKVTSAVYDPASQRISISLAMPETDAETLPELFVAGPPGYGFGKPENVRVTKRGATAEIPVRPPAKGGALESGSVVLVVRAGDRSLETSLAFD